MDLTPDLLRLAIDGDRAAVSTVTQIFLPRVYGLCVRLSRSRDLAEEATQETFVRALRALPALRSPESFGPWLLAIAANTTRELQRRRSPIQLDGDVPCSETFDDEPSASREKALNLALAELEDGDRELFLAHSLGRSSLEKLASRHGVTVAAMKSRVHRIRERVRHEAALRLEREGGLE